MELNRVEATICAISAGQFDTGSWPHSCILALGLSGQRNRLGAALLHLIEHQTDSNRQEVLRHLMTLSPAIDKVNATDAIKHFINPHCPTCGGRGVINFQQHQCPACSGRGTRPQPSNKETQDALSRLNQALDQLEHQQRARLR